MSIPFFSVVTPSWNQAAWVEGCIQSVLTQGVSDFEHIVFDNRSTDGTSEILARYEHLRVHIESDTGQSNALNKAMRCARGEVICWLNADDQYLPGAFEVVRREFAKPGVDVIYGDAEEDFCDGKPARVRRARFPSRDDLLVWWEKRTDLLQPAVFFRRRLLDEVGPLREDLHVVMDTELWWRLSERHAFHYVGAPLARQQRQPDSKTIKHVARIYEEKDRVFTPLLEEADPNARRGNVRARRLGMGRRWLGLAQSAAETNPEAARDFLARARNENTWLVLSPSWWRTWAATRTHAKKT
jgi:glycosyltransferase involved in cell wall biosynthesis